METSFLLSGLSGHLISFYDKGGTLSGHCSMQGKRSPPFILGRPRFGPVRSAFQSLLGEPMDAVSPAAGPSLATGGVSDQRFAAQLKQLQELKKFLFDEKVFLQTDILDGIDLGSLNNLKYTANGRLPTEGEWKALDQKLASLAALLTPPLRWKLRIRELQFFFITIPILFMVASVIATFSLALLMTFGDGSSFSFVVPYVLTLLTWNLSQGALGACAFLCISAIVHALKEKSASNSLDRTIDVTDGNVLSIRVILGALFALLALPISGKSTLIIYHAFLNTHPVPPVEEWIIVLLPFMFGFSTTLVLAIFNRIVGGISAPAAITAKESGPDRSWE